MAKEGKEGMGLEKLKEEYGKLEKKHKLPGFKEMNEDFWIEDLAETETDLLIRKVRVKVSDTLARTIRFIETLLNPVNGSIFIFSIIKALTSVDKEKLSDLYKQLSEKEIEFIRLDLGFSEEKEAEFIRNTYKFWQQAKKDIDGIMGKINKNTGPKPEANNREYFG